MDHTRGSASSTGGLVHDDGPLSHISVSEREVWAWLLACSRIGPGIGWWWLEGVGVRRVGAQMQDSLDRLAVTPGTAIPGKCGCRCGGWPKARPGHHCRCQMGSHRDCSGTVGPTWHSVWCSHHRGTGSAGALCGFAWDGSSGYPHKSRRCVVGSAGLWCIQRRWCSLVPEVAQYVGTFSLSTNKKCKTHTNYKLLLLLLDSYIII